jgi:hypothetical protein
VVTPAALQPRPGGTLSARIDTSLDRRTPALWYDLVVPLHRGELRLGFIPFAARRWDTLAGTVVELAREAEVPRDGRRERLVAIGALTADESPLAPSRVAVAEVVDVRARVQVTASALTLDAWVAVGPVAVRGDLAGAPPGADAALALAAEFLDLDAYDAQVQDVPVQLWPRRPDGIG